MTTRPHELSSLTLSRATPAQVLEFRRRNCSHWADTLTQDQYLERYNQMDAMEHATNEKMTTWVLVSRENLETLDFASACETYKRKGLIRYESREVQEVACNIVAHVFTPPDKRGKGYASHMMRLLHWVSTKRTSEHNKFPVEWGAPPREVEEAGDELFSVLYSGVGNKFYKETGPEIEKSGGWETRHPISTTWEISEQGEVEQETSDNTSWKWLKYGDLNAFWEKDVQHIRRTMEKLPVSHPHYHSEKPTAFVTCLPDEGVGSYSIFHSMFALDRDGVVSMDVWGLEKTTDHPDQSTYATWTIDTPMTLPPVLIITRLSATQTDFPGLINKIQEVARKVGVRTVEAWDICPNLLGAVAKTGGKTFARERRLPGLKWYDEGESAAIEWVFNERFSWC